MGRFSLANARAPGSAWFREAVRTMVEWTAYAASNPSQLSLRYFPVSGSPVRNTGPRALYLRVRWMSQDGWRLRPAPDDGARRG